MQPNNPQNSQQALAALQQFQTGAKNPNDFLAQQQQQLGVNAAQQNVTGLRGAVANTTKLLGQIAPSIMGRTGNSLVTNAQAVGQIQNAQTPIAQQLSTQSGNLNTATQDYNTLQSQAEQAAQGQYLGQQNQQSYLQNIYDVLYNREQQEQDRAEQIRQFNESLKTQREAAAGASPSFGLGGASGAGGSSLSDATKGQAEAAVYSLFATNNKDVIRNTVSAIKKSADYGNPYDRLKLQLIQSIHPEYLNGLGSAPSTLKNIGQNVLKASTKTTPVNSPAPVIPNLLKTSGAPAGMDQANNVFKTLGLKTASF